ncbi:MAG: IMP dehydrogenase [Bacteroidia bacterium]
MKFDFDDILLTPEIISKINSRKEINPYDINGMLPIFTAPMDTVVDMSNCSTFFKNKIYSILPRCQLNFILQGWNVWCAYGLEEFKEKFLDKYYFSPHPDDDDFKPETQYVLIDVANGHMAGLFEMAKLAKEKYGDLLVLMVGNVANPQTYKKYCEIGVDYVRCGIGGGQACLTSVQTGVGYPMASLINECYKIKVDGGFKTKIVADGGFKKFSDINKALALGSDYVMLGSMLNKCLESSATTLQNMFPSQNDNPVNFTECFDVSISELLIKRGLLFKQYRGMSTKEVQKDWGKSKIKTAEGISKYNKVEYTLKGFTENLEDYLRSAMSYTGSLNLLEFKGTEFELISSASFKRFEK